jgi:hypothetical protein
VQSGIDGRRSLARVPFQPRSDQPLFDSNEPGSLRSIASPPPLFLFFAHAGQKSRARFIAALLSDFPQSRQTSGLVGPRRRRAAFAI